MCVFMCVCVCVCVSSFLLKLGDDDGSLHSSNLEQERIRGLKNKPIFQGQAQQAWRWPILARCARGEKIEIFMERGESLGCKKEGFMELIRVPKCDP